MNFATLKLECDEKLNIALIRNVTNLDSWLCWQQKLSFAKVQKHVENCKKCRYNAYYSFKEIGTFLLWKFSVDTLMN